MLHASQCPTCGSPANTIEIGDLVSTACTKCGWKAEEMVGRMFPDMARAIPEAVSVFALGEVTAEGLALLRSLSPLLRTLPAQQLRDRLVSGDKLSLGVQPPYRAAEMQTALESAGFRVERSVTGDAA